MRKVRRELDGDGGRWEGSSRSSAHTLPCYSGRRTPCHIPPNLSSPLLHSTWLSQPDLASRTASPAGNFFLNPSPRASPPDFKGRCGRRAKEQVRGGEGAVAGAYPSPFPDRRHFPEIFLCKKFHGQDPPGQDQFGLQKTSEPNRRYGLAVFTQFQVGF